MKRCRKRGVASDGAERAAPGAAAGAWLGEFVRTPVFWMLAGMILLINTLNMGIQQHLIPYLTDIMQLHGRGQRHGALPGDDGFRKAGPGSFCDRRLKAGLGSYRDPGRGDPPALRGAFAAAVLFGVVYGFGNAIQTVLPPLMTVAGAGLAHFALIYGILTIFQTLGSGIGMPLSGYLYDWTGGYEAAFYVYIVLAVLAALLGVAALKRARFQAA